MAVHSRAAEAKGTMTQRTEVMLELVLDVKNNRRPKGSAAASQESLLSQGSLKFLRDSKGAEVQLRTVTWEKLLQPSKKVRQAAGLLNLTWLAESSPRCTLTHMYTIKHCSTEWRGAFTD